jgi:hypothetical protein
MIGSNGISFPTHLTAMQRHGTRLRPLKLKAIGTSFFLEYAGELRIIALRRKKIGPLQNTATSLRTGP